MKNFKDELITFFGEEAKLTIKEFLDLVSECKKSEVAFVKEIGQKTEAITSSLLQKKISKDEYKELMDDLLELQKVETLRISIKTKSQVQKIVEELRDAVFNKLFRL